MTQKFEPVSTVPLPLPSETFTFSRILIPNNQLIYTIYVHIDTFFSFFLFTLLCIATEARVPK